MLYKSTDFQSEILQFIYRGSQILVHVLEEQSKVEATRITWHKYLS